MKISIYETRTVPTIHTTLNGVDIYFHSKYDPLREAKAWAKQSARLINLQEYNEIVIFGVGAGYHIWEVARLYPNTSIRVIEFNRDLFSWFTTSPFIKHSEKQPTNVTFTYFKAITKDELNSLLSTTMTGNLLIHKSVLDVLPKECGTLKSILEDIQFKKKSIFNQIDKMKDNFKKNILLNDASIKKHKYLFTDKPMILVSAGPSLDKQISILKEIRKDSRFIIGAVGTALKPLIRNNLVPDLYCITDPNPATYEQLCGLNLEHTHLYYLSTAFHDTVSLHTGPRTILWQKDFVEAERMANQFNNPCIESGGSVATTLLSLMTFLGSGPIALVGQDLAFTDGLSHAAFSHNQKKLVDNSENVRFTTLDYSQSKFIATSKNLNVYRKWFEHFAESHPERKLVNCTEGGAYINNWEHISLKSFFSEKF